MTRAELVRLLVQNNPDVTNDDIEKAVRVIFDEISEALKCGHKVQLRGFGAFFTKLRPARLGLNPRNLAPVNVEAKVMPRFRASKTLLARLMTTDRH